MSSPQTAESRSASASAFASLVGSRHDFIRPLVLERLETGPLPSMTFGRGVIGFGGVLPTDNPAEEIRYTGVVAGGRTLILGAWKAAPGSIY